MRRPSLVPLFLLGAVALAACGRDAKGPLAPKAPAVVADATALTPSGSSVLLPKEPPLLLLTDKSDYAPGDTVHITGHGWKPGVEVQFVLDVDPPATRDPVTFSVLPDLFGDFSIAPYVVQESDVGVLFRLTATGDGQGGMAYFTDADQSGTTLSATKTATAHYTQTFHWTIDKSVDPASFDLFRGDAGTATYTIALTKDGGTLEGYLDGEVCVTNGGARATENLQIVDNVTMPPSSVVIASITVDVSAKPSLAPGENYCYPYQVDIPEASVVPGHNYKNTADITITNHAGHVGTPFGPNPSATATLPASPTLVNDAINVDDTNGGSWPFNATGSQTYTKTFTCDADKGEHKNTATIKETGQSDYATVTVNCYALEVSKTAATSFTRTYHWKIEKSADQSSLTLAMNQNFLVNYSVKVSVIGYTDSDWKVAGNITVHNPAPMAATINSLSDVVSGPVTGIIDCGATTFPYALGAGSDLKCTYSASLTDATARTNTATATLQNTPSGTTDFTGTASVDFGSATITKVDDQVSVTDTYAGDLGTTGGDKTYTYDRTIGPYTTCGDYKIDNTATFTTNTSGTTGSSSWTVDANVPCGGGCTLTIGYWKTHAGLGPQHDMLSQWLPIRLGTDGGAKSVLVSTAAQAVDILAYQNDASNGINKLMGQLLAAKLNITNGADGSAISSTISAADLFLAVYGSADWNSLTRAQKNQVLAWVVALDNYNNGLTGPGHCSQ
jgi:hypothetical protein